MYETHFGLKRRPFGETVPAAAYISSPSRDAVLRRLRYALEHVEAPALLFGPPGSGKTVLARHLGTLLAGPVLHLTFPALSPYELVAQLAVELAGAVTPPASLQAVLRLVQGHLSELTARGQRPLLIVDDAHLIETPATFETLRLLLNFATNGPSDLSLLLVGGAEVVLDLPAALADRLTARCLLGPYSDAESATYVLGRLAAAGARSELFDKSALAALHRAGNGLPRQVNRLADLALLIAYAKDLSIADESIIDIAARELSHDVAA